MNKKFLQYMICMGAAMFLLGCGALAPTATPVPSSTPTLIPPNSTPVPTNTSTPTLEPTATQTATPAPIQITTKLGDIILLKAEIVNENPMGDKAAPGYQILEVSFKSADGSEIDGTAFFNASRAVYVIGDDGSKTNSYMGGLVSGELMVGFTPPDSAHEFTLYWPDNDPVKLDLSQ